MSGKPFDVLAKFQQGIPGVFGFCDLVVIWFIPYFPLPVTTRLLLLLYASLCLILAQRRQIQQTGC
jgi:hypothetical protein